MLIITRISIICKDNNVSRIENIKMNIASVKTVSEIDNNA